MGEVGGVRNPVDYKRQRDIFNPARHPHARVVIVGLGNIGSHTVLALARMGIKHIVLYDDDVVEAHNLASQAYRPAEVGRPKVIAIGKQAFELDPSVRMEMYQRKFDAGRMQAGDILISAVDSMATRREIAAMLPSGVYVIDGRMGGGQIEVWCQDRSDWPATLTRDGDADPCGARYISYTSYVIAGLIANQVKRKLNGEKMAKRTLLHMDTLQLIVEHGV